jgi:spoIIIJ-associated protein
MEMVMKSEIIVTAPSIEAAIEKAVEELGAQKEDLEIEVIEEPSKRLFGESTDAKIRASLLVESADDQADENDYEPGDEDEQAPGDAFEGQSSSDEDEKDFLDEDEGELDEEDESEDEGDFSSEDERNFNEVPTQLTDEELDIIADTAIEVIRDFLDYFGVEGASIDEYEGDEGELILDIVGENLAVLIGRHGKTLESFQFLVSAIVGKKTGFRHPVIVDVEGYRHRRKQKLVSIAKSSAARAIRQKREVNLRPMSPYERRIVHVALKDDKRVVTSSEGAEPSRYVVIRLA